MNHVGSDAIRYRDVQMTRPSTNLTNFFGMAGAPGDRLNDHPSSQMHMCPGIGAIVEP
jgi:hypothetical protein